MRRILLGTLVGASLLLAGCAAPTSVRSQSPPASPSVQAPVPPEALTPVALPVSISVPAIDAQSSLVETGLLEEAVGRLVLEVAAVDKPEQASWWRDSPRPGMSGPAVVLGHVNGAGQPGVFARLERIQVGTIITVARVDGTDVRFVVYQTEKVDKDLFPFDQAFGETLGPELRLITCGGQFIGGEQGYEDNIIAYAKLTT